jgi:hypothetical protein
MKHKEFLVYLRSCLLFKVELCLLELVVVTCSWLVVLIKCVIGCNSPTLCTDCHLLIITHAPTCFGTYVPSLGSVLILVSYLNVRNGCVIGMYPCTVNVDGLCAPDVIITWTK